MARKRKDTFQDGPSFPDIGSDEPEEMTPEQQIAKLTKQLADMQAASQKAEQENQKRLVEMLAARPATVVVQPQQVHQPRTFTPKELPDPVQDPEGYARTMEENIRGRLAFDAEQTNAQREQVEAQQNQTSALWDEFQSRYPGLGGQQNFKKVEFVATDLVEQARRRGIEPSSYMFGAAKEQFMADVAREMERQFGMKADAPQKSTEADEDEDDKEPSEPENRTGGIFGGSESGGRQSSGGSEEKLGSITDDIKAWQLKTGFSR